MNYEQIETFLTVASYRNITAAANSLYLSQSTVSNRIQSLEDELKAPLFVRHKGIRTVELTSYGNAFIPIAEQWASLYKDTQVLKQKDSIHKLNIAAVDVVNTYTFSRLYNKIVDKHPNIKLSINTHHSNEIHGLVENRTADIGFTFSRVNYPNILSKPIFRELMYLACHKDSDYKNNMKCSDLSTDNEVFLNWGPDYLLWHNQHYSVDKYPLITVNTGNLLKHYLHKKNRWTIAPMSVIQAITGGDIVYYKLKDAPPPRICYEITNRYPNYAHIESIKTFDEVLTDYIINNKNICVYEDWMSEE